jgi:hypothetical protein
MGDDMFSFGLDQYERVTEVQFVSKTDLVASALDARRTLEAAIRKIPDTALHGLRLLRITVVTGATKQR